MAEKRCYRRLVMVVTFALPAIFLLLFVYDPPPRLAGRDFYWESYRISFEEDGTVLRGPWRGKYLRAADNLVCLGDWERRSGGGNLISRPQGFYHFGVSGLDITLTPASAEGRCLP